MALVIYLPEAIEDLHAIWRYLYEQSQSEAVADRIIDAIDDSAATYAQRPDLGIPRPELDPHVRCFPVARYVVFYVATTEGINIIQVIHGSRDLPRHWRGTS
ncbi:MAG TPA: type II toxin-antitoxin system RelE/ParE family toxin [Pirellulales bacterium]